MAKNGIRCTIVFLGLVFILGFYLRIESLSGTQVVSPLRADAGQYFTYAYNLRFHQTYSKEIGAASDKNFKSKPDSFRSPGYPLSISMLMDAIPTGKTIHKILFFQVIISMLTLLLSFGFFKSFLPIYCALLASFFTALSPHLIVANSYILTETLFCFLLVFCGLFLSLFASHRSYWLFAILGMAIAFAALVRPSLQFFPIVMALLLIVQYGRKRGLRFLVALLAGFILVFSPWLIRNTMTIKSSSDNKLKINFLHHGMYPDFTYDNVKESYGYPYLYDPQSKEIGKSMASVLKEIQKRFWAEPFKYFRWYLIKKPFAYWSWNIVQGQGDVFIYPVSKTPYASNLIFQWTHKMMHFLHWPLVLLSLIGSLLVWIFPQTVSGTKNTMFVARFVSVLLLYFTLLHMIGAPFPRYSVPLRPFQYGMALYCLYFVYKFFNQRIRQVVGF